LAVAVDVAVAVTVAVSVDVAVVADVAVDVDVAVTKMIGSAGSILYRFDSNDQIIQVYS
jgi:hypothetical protein